MSFVVVKFTLILTVDVEIYKMFTCIILLQLLQFSITTNTFDRLKSKC